MTNLPKVGDQSIVTNANGSVTITTVTDARTVTVIRPTLVGWILIGLLIVGIAATVLERDAIQIKTLPQMH